MNYSLLVKTALVISTILISHITNGQINHRLIKKIDSLRNLGADTIIYYQPPWSPTTEEANDTCIMHQRGYLLWRQGNDMTILKEFYSINIKSNSSYPIVSINKQTDSLGIFDYLASNFNSIIHDKMLKALLRKTKNGEMQVQDFNKISVSDDAYTGISITVGNKTYENGYAENDLNEGIVRNVDGSIREVWESLHYKANTGKSIYKIITKIETQILALERPGVF